MRTLLKVALIIVVLLAVTSPGHAGDMKAQTAFDELKSLAGTWRGTPEGEGMEAEAESKKVDEVVHEFQVSAAGTVVMETMGPGTEHEMINMYHLDGEDLVLTHYCAGGNQPKMKLDRDMSSVGKLVFDFTGGTNLDPAVDSHIHSAEIKLTDPEHLESIWESYAGGKKAGGMIFHLARSD
ncbi:MAG: hypothetical protein WBG49_13855 [Thermoanaerobaculia bacterium]